MKAITLENTRRNDFINYCVKYRFEHDSSFLYDDDLNDFMPGKENPTCILIDNNDNVIGAASLLLASQYKNKHRSRFRIFHSSVTTLEAYKLLLDTVIKDLDGIEDIFLFIPENKSDAGDILKKLDFSIQRYAWSLIRSNEDIPQPVFPDGYTVKPFRKGKDEIAWCNINNAAFSIFSWHTDITPERVKFDEAYDTYIYNGALMLWKDEEPIGIICVEKDPEDGMSEIGPIAILPQYQGKGLGRNLLRAGLEAGRSAGLPASVLSVNGDNEKAAALYFSEGFKKETLMICYNKKL